MDKYINAEVESNRYGKGIAKEITEGYVIIVFNEEEKKFQFPLGFDNGKYIRFTDLNLQEEVQNLCDAANVAIMKEKNEMAEEREKIRTEQERQKQLKKSDRSVRHNTVREYLTIGDSFRTHADALNECFGFAYEHFQKAYKTIDDDYAAWFPGVARYVQGKYEPTESSEGWINIISEGGTVITEPNVDISKNIERQQVYERGRFVFAKYDTDYVFVGVFAPDYNPQNVSGGYRYKK